MTLCSLILCLFSLLTSDIVANLPTLGQHQSTLSINFRIYNFALCRLVKQCLHALACKVAGIILQYWEYHWPLSWKSKCKSNLPNDENVLNKMQFTVRVQPDMYSSMILNNLSLIDSFNFIYIFHIPTMSDIYLIRFIETHLQCIRLYGLQLCFLYI